MPEAIAIAPPAPPPPTPPAAETPPVAPVTPPPADTPSVHTNEFLARTMQDLGVLVADSPPVEAPVAPPPPPPVTPAAPAAPADPPPPPKPEIKKKPARAIEDIVAENVRESVARAFKEQQTAAPSNTPAATIAPATPPSTPEDTLSEVERDELSLWRYAEQKFPDKYKGSSQRYLAALGQIESYIEKARSTVNSEEERTLDANDPDLQKFISETLPSFQGADRRRLERAMISDEATDNARKEFSKKQEDLEKKQHALEVKPEIERAVTRFATDVRALIQAPVEGQPPEVSEVVSEVMAKSNEEGWAKAIEADPYHAPIVKASMDKSVRRASAYLALLNNVTTYTPMNPDRDLEDARNDHAWLTMFIRKQGDFLSAAAPEAKVREIEGERKEFIPVHEFVARYQQDPTTTVARHWTFTEGDVLAMLADFARREAGINVKREIDRATAAGYKREKRAPAAPAPAPAAPAAAPRAAPPPPRVETPAPVSPRATAGVSPGAATGVPSSNGGLFSSDDFRILGLPQPK